MGIPAFYRWLVDRYPKCVVKALEDRPLIVNGIRVPVDVTAPNPNGVEYDNLYLDMNGIIHPCFHPEGMPGPTTYEAVFEAMFKYIDKIFSIVRPRKLLFIAIDGVAPRAKMNQQRARRFKAAKEAAEAAEALDTLESEKEKATPVEQPKMDSNVITPGTEFMELLSSALRYYIHLRMNEDLGWKGIKVILSDATVPGEGEHKVMSYIRLQRNLPGYDPNTRHCMYGLDADLIMLALATHEINFSILREDGRHNKQNRKYRRRLMNQKKRSGVLEDIPEPSELLESNIINLKFQFLNIWVLREYLRHDMEISDPAVKGDLERFIDDFVFMCLFVGNDFLPQIPSLEISEGAINLLLMIYKDEFVKRGGYLTNSFEVKLERVEHFLHSIGASEYKIIGERISAKAKKKRKRTSISCKLGCDGSRLPSDEPETKSRNIYSSPKTIQTHSMEYKENPSGIEGGGSSFRCVSNGRNTVTDEIKLDSLDWKERFYVEKFEAKTIDDCERIKKDAVFKYVEGICWVMRYYYQEVCSWQWFYPYHYAPFASDFVSIDQLEIQFTLGEPFKPFDQLLGVLPAARKLMTDSSSPILDFYPTDFEADMEGKRFAWQAVVKLPFIEESRLLSEIAKVENTLTDEDRTRNAPGLDVLFVNVSHPLAMEINSICEGVKDTSKLSDTEIKWKIDPALSGGMNGYIYISDKPVRPLEIYSPLAALRMIAQNDVISVFYKYPPFHSHIPRPPHGVTLPETNVRKEDLRPLSKIWCSKDACLLYARKTRAVCSIINSRRNKLKTHLGSCKRQAIQRIEAGYALRRHLVVNRCTKDKSDSVLNCDVKKLNNCDPQKWRKGDGNSVPEDAALGRKEENKSSEGGRKGTYSSFFQVPCEGNKGKCSKGVKEADREVKHHKVNGVSLNVEKNVRGIVGEQTNGGGPANKTLNAVESKNKRLRSKKRERSDDVAHSNDEKMVNFENIELSKSDANNGPVADRLEEKMVEIKHSELNAVLCNEISKGTDARKGEVGLHADLNNDEVEYKSHGELERGQKKNEGGQLGNFIKWEQTEVDKSRDGMGTETEIRSNKKRRSKKRKHTEDIGQNNDENLKRFFVREPTENDGHLGMDEIIMKAGDGVHNDGYKMVSSIMREQQDEAGLHAGPAGIGEVKTDVKSKKRKQSREKKCSNSGALSCNNDAEFKSYGNRKQLTVVGHDSGATGVAVLKAEVKSCSLTDGSVLANGSSGKLEDSFLQNRNNRASDNASVCAFQEMRTEVESAVEGMKQKTNLKPSNDEKVLSSFPTEYTEGTSGHATADGLLVKNSEAQPITRRQKKRLKKAKLMAGVALADDSTGKSEGSVLQNGNNKDGDNARVCAFQERAEVESTVEGMKQKMNLEPSNDAKLLSSIHTEHNEGTSGHAAADGLLVKNSEVQPLTRRQKRGLKKAKLMADGALANDSSGKLECPVLQNQNNQDGYNTLVCAFQETRSEVESAVEGLKQESNWEPSNDAKLLSSIHTEHNEGTSGHAAADGLLVKSSEAQPLTRRQKRRLKKAKLMADSPLVHDISGKLEGSVFQNQNNQNGDNANVCAFQETRAEVDSAVEGMKQKTNLEPTNDAKLVSSIHTEHNEGTSGHAAAGGLLVKNSEAQPMTRRQKRRLKKAKLMADGALANASSGKLEGSVPQNQNNQDGDNANVFAFQETRTEVESAVEGLKQKMSLEPSNDAEMLSRIPSEHNEGTGGRATADELLMKNSETQPMTQRQKRKLKKAKLMVGGALTNDSTGKLEGSVLQNRNNRDGDIASVCAFQERTEVESPPEGMKQKMNLEPSKNANLISSIHTERNEGTSGHPAADGLLVNSEGQPLTRRQKRRLKKAKLMAGGALANDSSGKLEGSACQNQINGGNDNSSLCAFQERAEV